MRRADHIGCRPLLWGAALVLAALGSVQTAGGPGAARMVRAADEPTRVLQPLQGSMPTVSADGVHVAAVVDDAVVVTDRTDGSTFEVTPVASDLVPGVSVWPVVSGDGCSVTFTTQLALDRFRDDDGGTRFDVYQQQLPVCGGEPGDWQLVSVALGSTGSSLDVGAGDDVSPLRRPAVSADGTLVAYERVGLDGGVAGVVLVDLAVPLGRAGRADFIAGATEPAISADGATLAYTLDAGVVVQEVGSSSTRTIAERGGSAAVSSDGAYVAFVSDDQSLVPSAVLPECVPRCVTQVYVRELSSGRVLLGSRVPGNPDGPLVGADADALQPVLGEGLDELLFITRATNLFPSRSASFGAPSEGDVVLAAPSAGSAVRLSTLADGLTPAPSTNTNVHMSPTARVVVFDHRDPATGERAVSVVDVAPQLVMTDLDLGTAAVGSSGPEWYLQVVNHGPSAFVPHSLRIDNPSFVVSGGTCVEPADVPLPPGSSCSVLLVLVPTDTGAHTGVLTVSENADEVRPGTAVSVSATLSGVGGRPSIEAMPGGGDGGVVQVGTVGSVSRFDVLNVDVRSVRLQSVTIEGEQAVDFVVRDDDCTDRVLSSGARCTVEVAFAPTAVGGVGRRSATVVVRASGSTTYATYLISGTAFYVPMLSTSADPVAAGSRFTLVGSGFAPRTAVTVGWADGAGGVLTVLTDDSGAWSVDMLVRATDRTGARTIVAQTVDGQLGSVPVRVVPPATRFMPGAATWPTRQP